MNIDIKKNIKVWDAAVRIFHWSLVLFFALALISGDDAEGLHALSGYVICGLLIFRIIWGFIGTRYARFSDFIYDPGEITAYLSGFLSGRSKYYLGHNPAGGLMIVVLLLSLSATCWTGLKTYGAEGHGPLAAIEASGGISFVSTAYADSDDDDRYEGKRSKKSKKHSKGEEFWEEIHEFFVGFTIFLVIVHILGVVVTTLFHREPLIRAMITGRKPLK